MSLANGLDGSRSGGGGGGGCRGGEASRCLSWLGVAGAITSVTGAAPFPDRAARGALLGAGRRSETTRTCRGDSDRSPAATGAGAHAVVKVRGPVGISTSCAAIG